MKNSKSNPSEEPIASPCISHCTLDEDDVCVGCLRHIDEITGWHGADNGRRKEILEKCSKRRLSRRLPFE